MAQTLEEIQADIEAAQAEFPELAALNSPSATSFWRLIKNMFALLVLNLQKSMDAFRVEINAVSDSKNAGTLRWYAQKSKEFQFGDNLIIDENGIRYPVDNPEKRIIAQAAAAESDFHVPPRIIIKVAKKDQSDLVPLNELELSAFNEYMSNIRFCGIDYQVVSLPADLVRLYIRVVLNPLEMQTDGTQHDDGFALVDNTIKTFLQNLRFDSRFYVSELVAALMSLSEVKDAKIGFMKDLDNFPGQIKFPVEFTHQTHYDSMSGHLALHPDSIIEYSYED